MKLKKVFLELSDEEIGPLETQWRDYRKSTIHPQAPKQRLVESKQDFFAGAFTLLHMLQDADAWTEPPPENIPSWREALIVEIFRELRGAFDEAVEQAQTLRKATEAEMKKKAH